MTNQNEIDENRKVFRKDTWFACSMLLIYAICLILFISGSVIWIGKNRKATYANATSTQAAIVTEQAYATATAVARVTEQAQYDFIDRFDTNKYLWRTQGEDNEYWTGSTKVTAGIYTWQVTEVKDIFISWADFPVTNYMRDFDVYVDTKFPDAAPGDVCSGLQFRVSTVGWDDGGYYFGLCNDSSVSVSYHTEVGGWERIATHTYQNFREYDWNRLEIVARGTHFSFFINGEMIYEMDDDRRESGGLALVIELNEKVPATIWFDNFGLQRR